MRLTRKHKFNAKKAVVDGITFDSTKEANRYKELKLMEKGKLISELQLQPIFEYIINGKKMFRYRADFFYRHLKNFRECIYEDVKGYKTPMYRLKKKIIEAHFGIKINEI